MNSSLIKMKLSLLKKADLFLGMPLIYFARLFPFSRNEVLSARPRILIIRPGGIGDAVILLPVVAHLKKKYPDAMIDILAEKRNESVFSLSSSIRKIYCYDEPKALFMVLRYKYDVVIDTEQWHRLSALTTRMTNAPIRIGYATNERWKMFTHSIAYSHEDSEKKSFFNLLTPFTIEMPVEDEKDSLTIPLKISEKIKLILQPLLSRKIIALFPGGSIIEKRWEVDKFREVAKKITQHGYCAVIIGGKEDVRDGLEIVTGLSNIVNLCGRLSLSETAAVFQEVQLLITGDSGILHIADAMRKKIVALFGPGNVKKWAPRGKHVAVITKNLGCSPCSTFGYTPRCKNNVACMKNITVEEVYTKAIELLEK